MPRTPATEQIEIIRQRMVDSRDLLVAPLLRLERAVITQDWTAATHEAGTLHERCGLAQGVLEDLLDDLATLPLLPGTLMVPPEAMEMVVVAQGVGPALPPAARRPDGRHVPIRVQAAPMPAPEWGGPPEPPVHPMCKIHCENCGLLPGTARPPGSLHCPVCCPPKRRSADRKE